MKSKNWTHLFPKYAGLWVAFDKDEETIIASSKSLKITLKKAKKKGISPSPVFKVPQKMMPYVGQI